MDVYREVSVAGFDKYLNSGRDQRVRSNKRGSHVSEGRIPASRLCQPIQLHSRTPTVFECPFIRRISQITLGATPLCDFRHNNSTGDQFVSGLFADLSKESVGGRLRSCFLIKFGFNWQFISFNLIEKKLAETNFVLALKE